MLEIAVFGEEEFTVGFRLAGVQNIIEMSSPKEAEAQIKDIMSQKNIGIVITSTKTMEHLSKDVQQLLHNSVSPVTVVVSDKDEMSNLRESIKKAIGVDLWK